MIPSHHHFIHRLVQVWCYYCLLFPFPFLSTIVVVVNGQVTTSCFSSINDVEAAESSITDFSVVRQYILCPESIYTIGRQDYFGAVLFETGSQMIHLRPNVHIQCGDSGSRSNNCIISGGTVQVDGTSFFLPNATATVLSNVMITGLTFSSVEKHHVWIDQPGQVIFNDCSFQDSTNAIVPILLDYFDPASTTSVLDVTIQACEFLDNTYYGSPAQASLIVGNSKQNRLILTDSNFTRNDMVFNNTNYDRASFLIESSGPVEMTRNCFQHNALGVAPVGVYGSSIVATDNFQYNSTGGVCQMSAYFTGSSYTSFTPICAIFDSPNCKAILGGDVVPTTTMPIQIAAPTAPPTNSTATSIAPSTLPTAPLNFSEPTMTPTPSLVVGNTTNRTSIAPVPGMVFWTPPPAPAVVPNGTAPTASSESIPPISAPTTEEVRFNTTTTSSSSLLFIDWSYMLFGSLTTLLFIL